MPLAEAYRARIYEPLGMASTFLDCYEEPKTDIVQGYTGTADALTDVTELHESVGWSAGGLVSTAPDLIAFARGLFGGALFDDPQSLVAMMPAPGSPYGLGIANQGGNVGHAGYIAGFRSTLTYAPELGGTHGTGFGLATNLDEVRAGTILALQSAVGILSAKAPEELEPYRRMVLGAATVVAEAKKGVSPPEDAVISAVKDALGTT